MRVSPDVACEVSLDVSPDVSSGQRSNGSAQAAAEPERPRPPGRYLVRSGSVYLFQIRMPDDVAGTRGRVIRLGLGALTAREARARADLLAALARNRFEQMRIARMQENRPDADDGGTDPYFDGGSPEITMAEVKGYLKAMLSVISQPSPPTPPDQEASFAGMRGLVALNRELAKGMQANPLIAENAEYLKAQSIAKISCSVGAGDRAVNPTSATGSAAAPASAVPAAAPERTESAPWPEPRDTSHTNGAPAAASSAARDRPVQIHRDADGKIIPAFKLDRRTVQRRPSDLPRLSEVAEDYFAARAVTSGENNKDIRIARVRLGVFLDLIGDHPVDTYSGADLQAYVALMTHWPAFKRHRPADKSPREILAANADLRFKPLARSALEDGYVTIAKTVIRHKMTEWDYPDPLAGVKLRYPDTAAPKVSAEPLSSEKVSAIFRTGVAGGLLDEATLPLLGQLTGRRLGLLVHLTGNDIRQKYPGIWVAQTSGIVLTDEGVWRRVPIKTDASTSFFVLHDFLREIGFIEWATSRGDAFLFEELTRLADPSKSASSYMGRLFRKAGITGSRREVFHSLRGGFIEQMRDNNVDARDRRLQAGHQLEDEHELYGFRAISEVRARQLAHARLTEDIDYSVFDGLDFRQLANARRRSGPRRKK